MATKQDVKEVKAIVKDEYVKLGVGERDMIVRVKGDGAMAQALIKAFSK